MTTRASSFSRTASRLLLAALLVPPMLSMAQFTTPNVVNIPGAVTNRIGGTTFINQGLVAVGRISASTIDSFGETFGSISSMQVTGWTNNGDGSYSGTLSILPDRGYNSGSFFADYAARINEAGFTFKPYSGSTNIGGTTLLEKLNAQTNQLTFGPITGVKFTYDDPNSGPNSFTTGLDPGTNYTTLFNNQILPYVPSYTGFESPSATSNKTYTGINKLAIDAEALVINSDGSGYVGDEYGANIYYFDSTKKITGVIIPPAAFQPFSPSNTPNFNSLNAPLSGRRNNQGFEGVTLSPDGTRLFALLQSSTVQDADGNQQNRRQTRLLVYDVSTNPTNSTPLAEHALTLPTFRTTGNGAAVNATAAQSEIVALDNSRILVLSRDGNGLGSIAPNPNVFKSILLVDLSAGTPSNFASDVARNAEGGKITTSPGVLDPTIKPLNWVEVINLLNTNQLGKFNVTFDSGTNQVTKLTLGEKWEGMSLVYANDPTNRNDYFLFVGNDNDFITSAGQIQGPGGTNVTYNAFNGYPANRIPAPLDTANSENDTRILVYRVTIVSAFTPGNLVVERVGNGSTIALNSSGTNVFVDEYTSGGVLVQSKGMPNGSPRPTASPYNLVDSGSATSNGQLTRSADGKFICISGYNGTLGEAGIAGSSAATVLRVVGTIDAAGNIDTSKAAVMLSGNNYRSLTSSDGTNFWATGQPGLVYYREGVATNVLLTSNLRCVRIFNNQLYISSGSVTPGIGVHSVGTGLPTAGAQTTTQLISVGGAGTASPFNFEFNPAMTVAYVADDRNNGSGGIIKYTNSGVAWVSNYTFTTGSPSVGARGLTVDWSGSTPVIYATTAENSTNRLVRIIDTNSAATAFTLATSPTNTAFRGVAFAPSGLEAPTILSVNTLGSGFFQVVFSGALGQTYSLIATTNLSNSLPSWSNLTNGVFGTNSVTNTDSTAPGRPARYYRVTSP